MRMPTYEVSDRDLDCLAHSEPFKQRRAPKTLDGWVAWMQNHLATCGANITAVPTQESIKRIIANRFERLTSDGFLTVVDGVYEVTPAWYLANRWQLAMLQYTETSFFLLPSTEPDCTMMAVTPESRHPVCHFKTPEAASQFLAENGQAISAMYAFDEDDYV